MTIAYVVLKCFIEMAYLSVHPGKDIPIYKLIYVIPFPQRKGLQEQILTC